MVTFTFDHPMHSNRKISSSKNMNGRLSVRSILSLAPLVWALTSTAVFAQSVNLPSAVDPGRVKPEEQMRLPTEAPPAPRAPAALPTAPVPKGAENVRFVLCGVRIEGNTAFSDEDLQDVYAAQIGEEVSLDTIYTMAGEITRRYRDEGYFLSIALVPDQQIENGVATIRIVEGYVGDVLVEGEHGSNHILDKYIADLLTKRPLKSDEMESFLLRVNDLPGIRYSGVLLPAEDANNGAVKLSLMTSEKEGSGSISFDNLSSRYLGPHQLTASYSNSFLPLQQTSLLGLTSVPLNRLNYAAITHSIAIAPDWTLDFNTSASRGRPKYVIDYLDIKSDSYFVSSMLRYQWIRQRQMNMSFRVGIDGRNTNSDVFGNAALTRDRIRALRAGFNFDAYDSFRGYSSLSMTVSKGLSAFGASEAGEITLSRFEADPEFTKAELSFTRLQGISSDWSGIFSLAGQVADGPLFSAEEFGYGGSSFGRSFDLSEITGDHGVSTSVEVQYNGLQASGFFSRLTPYGFYDFGMVWNDDAAQVKETSGSSAGIGIRGVTQDDVSANLTLAFPLTREVSSPIYGQNESGPRLLLQVSKNF